MKKRLSMFLAFILVVSLFSSFTVSAQDEGVWTVSDYVIPTTVRNQASVEVDGKIYLIGGGVSAASPESYNMYEYDVEANYWTKLANLPTALYGQSAVYLNGKIYAMGGISLGYSSKKLLVYDIASNTWQTKADMPIDAGFASSAAVDDLIYVCGGMRNTRDRGFQGVNGTMFVYDPATNVWTKKANMLIGSFGSSKMTYNNGELFFFGGTIPWSGNVGQHGNTSQKYNIAKDKWDMIAQHPKFPEYSSIVVDRNDVYVIGGGGGFTPIKADKSVYKYSTKEDKWELHSYLPEERTYATAQMVDRKIFLFGGSNTIQSNVQKTIFTYQLPPPPNPSKLSFTNVTAKATLYDEEGKPIKYSKIQHSLSEPYEGVTVDSDTGVVTIFENAKPGTVWINATYQNLSTKIGIVVNGGTPPPPPDPEPTPNEWVNTPDPNINLTSPEYRETAIASNTWNGIDTYSIDKALDGNINTRWASDDKNPAPAVLTVTFKDAYKFNEIYIHEAYDRINSYKIEYLPLDATATSGTTNNWVEFCTGTTLGTGNNKEIYLNGFGEIVTKSVRITMQRPAGVNGVSISEFHVTYK